MGIDYLESYKEMVWGYFTQTGNIKAYILYTEISNLIKQAKDYSL